MIFADDPVVDVFWEGVPNWIVAGTGVVTLLAAATAAVFAGFAAFWTKKQADSGRRQAEIADGHLMLAQTEARSASARLDEQREEARHAERRQAEMRLDAIAPVVLAKARRTNLLVQRPRAGDFDMVSHEMTVGDPDPVLFRTAATITFNNVSSRIARVDIVDPAQGELSIRSGETIFLAPGGMAEVFWHRNISSAALRTEEDLGLPENWWMTVRFWVRDLGMNVRDEFRFGADYRHFKLDGSRLIASPELDHPWELNTAEPTGPRIYERLDEGLDGISPAGGSVR